LDLFSYGRRGPQASIHLSRSQREQIARTVGRVPEVMVKVTGGGTNLGVVRAHLSYISRHGKAPVETDDEQQVLGKDAMKSVLDDWHLELSKGQYRRTESGKPPPRALKLVHNIVLSMPAPTPPKKVLAAAQRFAREKFALEHRYAMVLHTDQKHPHVHLVVKAEGLHGKKLHIDKAMLREWREDFARLMREEGVEANASRRVLRGRAPGTKRDEILRARLGGNSTFMREKVKSAARELVTTGTIKDPGRKKLLETRKAVVADWMQTAEILDRQGELTLAAQVREFVRKMPPVLTDREQIAIAWAQEMKSRRPLTHEHEQPGKYPGEPPAR
jgi:hypothetical protein